MCVCVCVCVRERERERERVCACVCVYVRACVHVCMLRIVFMDKTVPFINILMIITRQLEIFSFSHAPLTGHPHVGEFPLLVNVD